ncbi:serine hydrolase [Mycoplasmatota bacterium WC30]
MVFPKAEFNKASVKDADMNKELLVDLFNEIETEKLNIHSILLLKEGSRVFRASAHTFTEDTKEEVYSVSKSFTSVAIGILCDLNILHLDDYILYFFSKEISDYLPGYEKIQVKHLLSMSSGQEKDIFSDLTPNDDLYKLFFNQPLVHKPGEVFNYSNFSSFILSAIVTKVTGKSLNDFLNEYLYKHIGMEKPNWNQVKGINFGASGIHVSANDMARFGLLLLNDGNWDGKQIISKKYLDLATQTQIETKNCDEEADKFGYGFQFWINSFGDYRCAGLYRQYIVINKKFNLVFVVKAFEERQLLDLFENYIIPACKKGWNYCDYSLRDYTRRFKQNSIKIIEKEKEMRID